MKEARLYEKLPKAQVECRLCAHRCTLADGNQGICQVRRNEEGILYTVVYGRVIAEKVDPVEKKPLYHFHPGSRAYSIGTPGCNFRCGWCQNAEISQMPRGAQLLAGEEKTAEQIVESARGSRCRSIAFTYTEPTIFFEYAMDIGRLARESGLANIFVTNGFMTPEALEAAAPWLDAANVDLKSFRDETYRKQIGARLQPVLDSLKGMKETGMWVEVTTLVIPGVNDDAAELRDLAEFLARELGEETPWHLSRFFPAYRVRDVVPTPVSALEQAREIGLEAGLRYVYLGNIPGRSDTLCHHCGAPLVRRTGFRCVENRIGEGSRCPECGAVACGSGMVQGARQSAV